MGQELSQEYVDGVEAIVEEKKKSGEMPPDIANQLSTINSQFSEVLKRLDAMEKRRQKTEPAELASGEEQKK